MAYNVTAPMNARENEVSNRNALRVATMAGKDYYQGCDRNWRINKMWIAMRTYGYDGKPIFQCTKKRAYP